MITRLEAVRVQDIILDQNHPRYFGEDSIGTILWTFLDEYPPVNPNTGVNDKIDIRLSNIAFEKLNAKDEVIPVELTYVGKEIK